LELSVSDFRERAACRDVDPELFFPVGTGQVAQAQIAAAKQICGGCEAQLPCLEWSIENGQDEGVWGGLDVGERRNLRRGVRGAA
jgi:WhiB family redox-sensing transcriptional regulator